MFTKFCRPCATVFASLLPNKLVTVFTLPSKFSRYVNFFLIFPKNTLTVSPADKTGFSSDTVGMVDTFISSAFSPSMAMGRLLVAVTPSPNFNWHFPFPLPESGVITNTSSFSSTLVDALATDLVARFNFIVSINFLLPYNYNVPPSYIFSAGVVSVSSPPSIVLSLNSKSLSAISTRSP